MKHKRILILRAALSVLFSLALGTVGFILIGNGFEGQRLLKTLYIFFFIMAPVNSVGLLANLIMAKSE